MKNTMKAVVAAAVLALGCARGSAADEADTESPAETTAAVESPAGAPTAGASTVTAATATAAKDHEATDDDHASLVVAHPGAARLDAPSGWKTRAQSAWTITMSPDGDSRIVHGSIDAGAVVAAKVGQAAAAVGASDLHLTDEQTISFGAEQLPAQVADGWCHLDKAEARIAYAVVDAGDGQRMLVVHVSSPNAGAETQRAALTAIASLRHGK